MDSFTSLPYARSSLLEGLGRLFDFGNHLNEYTASLTPEQADALALYADWVQIGDDFRFAMDEEAATFDSYAPLDSSVDAPDASATRELAGTRR